MVRGESETNSALAFAMDSLDIFPARIVMMPAMQFRHAVLAR
jgi:hypothetical protein